MREIHDPHDAEDQRQADPEKSICASQEQSVDEMLKKLLHARVPGSCT